LWNNYLQQSKQNARRSRTPNDTFITLYEKSSLFFDKLRTDLKDYARHAGRPSEIKKEDVILKMKLLGIINDKRSLKDLIRLELDSPSQEFLIPTPGPMKIILKKDGNQKEKIEDEKSSEDKEHSKTSKKKKKKGKKKVYQVKIKAEKSKKTQ